MIVPHLPLHACRLCTRSPHHSIKQAHLFLFTFVFVTFSFPPGGVFSAPAPPLSRYLIFPAGRLARAPPGGEVLPRILDFFDSVTDPRSFRPQKCLVSFTFASFDANEYLPRPDRFGLSFATERSLLSFFGLSSALGPFSGRLRRDRPMKHDRLHLWSGVEIHFYPSQGSVEGLFERDGARC